MYLDLTKIKKHLNINEDYTADDMYLTDLSEVAEKVVETHIDNKLDIVASNNGGTLPAPILHAMLLFIGNMYANRESVAFVSANEIPLSYAYILDLYKCYYHNNDDEDEEMIIIIDNLNSDRTDAALSARQGKVLKQLIDNIDAYNKSEVDSKLDVKANVADVYPKSETYSKLEVDAKIDEIETGGADLTYYYNKSEVDSKLDVKANVADVYPKSETYSKLEVDAKIDEIEAGGADLTNYYNKSEVDGLLADKADSTELAAKLNIETYNLDKSTFALKSEIPDTSEFITNSVADSKYQAKGDYLTEIPAEYVTDDELNSKGYLTEIPAEYVTDDELTSKGYATTTQLSTKLDASTYNADKETFATKTELSTKADATDLGNYVTTETANSTYATKSEIGEINNILDSINGEMI